MSDSINQILEYLVGIQLHPAVTLVVFLMIAVGKQRWEEPWVQKAKEAIANAAKCTGDQASAFMQEKVLSQMNADRNANRIMLVGLFTSILGEFALYWPRSGQAMAICAFMSLAQVGVGWFLYFFLDKWGIADRIGLLVQKKIEAKS